MGEFCIRLGTRITSQYALREGQCVSCTLAYLSPCMCCRLSRCTAYCTTKEKAVIVGVVILCSGNGRHALHVWSCQWEFPGSKSPVRRTLSTTQNPIFQIIYQTSPATERIWVLCSFSWCTLQCYPQIQSNVKLAHISAGIDFWTYVDCDFFAHLSEFYTFFNPVTPFFSILYMLGNQIPQPKFVPAVL
jgi:hypothetical protein